MAFPKPPPAASGKAYKTLDGRCRACKIMGGRQAPCQPKGILAAIKEETGHPCPRRESHNVDDGVCFELLQLAASPGPDRLFPVMVDRLLADMDPDHQLRVLRRVKAGFCDARIVEHLPKRMI